MMALKCDVDHAKLIDVIWDAGPCGLTLEEVDHRYRTLYGKTQDPIETHVEALFWDGYLRRKADGRIVSRLWT